MKKPLLLLMLYLPFLCRAQSNYKQGYIVNLKNDTASGFIDYREWTRNPKSISFKHNLSDSKVERLSASDINGFGIPNLAFYKSATVHVSTAGINVGSLKPVIDTSYIISNVFLKMITTGKYLSLYYFTDDIKTRYYVEDVRDGQIKELNYYVYLDNNNNSSVKTEETYKRQLLAIALSYDPGNEKMITMIQSANYIDFDIKPIVRIINGGESNQFKQKSISGVRFFVGAGLNLNTLTYTAADMPFIAGSKSSNTVPALSGGIDLFLDKNTQKIVFRAEINIVSNQYSYNNYTPSDLVTDRSLAVKQFNASLTPQILFNFYSTEKFKAFIDAGLSLTFSSYNNYNYILVYSDGQTVLSNKFPGLEKTWTSFELKAGITISNRIQLYGTYYIPTSLSTLTNNEPTNLKAFQFGVNYLF